MNAATPCFHCGEPVPAGVALTVRLADGDRPMCCTGCKAAAEFIRDAGLTDYYRFRDAPAPRPDEVTDDTWVSYDRPDARERLVARHGELSSVNLLLEGMRCAACGWLIERRLERVPGVTGAAVSAATGRARLEWRSGEVALSRLLRTVHELGYRPHVLGAGDTLEIALRERRAALKRIAVAGLGMMQVLMFAVALYAGAFEGMDPTLRHYLRLVSMLVATPVLLYSGRPFIEGAWRDLTARQPGMDVPVALALLLAYGASSFNTLAGRGEVYFDSVTMFVFLLLLGRFAEMSARHQAGSTSDALLRMQPVSATRMAGTRTERVPVADLAPGDIVVVPTGVSFPADGVLTEGETWADESLVTGESAPLAKCPGDALVGGSANAGRPVCMRVTAVGQDTVLAAIVRLLERAQTERPAIARLADRWASRFVVGVLLAALAVAVAWLAIDASRAFEATLAVLVVTCPCALSLATPTAITAATAALARGGLLVTRAEALESMAAATCVVVDKTGTLTIGHPAVTDCEPLGGLDCAGALRVAAALEQYSAHPLAQAFRQADGPLPTAARVETRPGSGIEGLVDGRRTRIGGLRFVAGIAPDRVLRDAGIYLAREGEWLARFEVRDPLRSGVADAVREFGRLGLSTTIASGDEVGAVAAAAAATGIASRHARLSPEDKLALVRRLERQGEAVLMVGDGVNDAPVLAAASVSVAMGAGASLAQTSADAVLMSQDLRLLPAAVRFARRTLSVVRQNLGWAVAYNLSALPLAALGFIPPWAAAIGMSASSLMVVGNAMRLRTPAPVEARSGQAPAAVAPA